MVQSRQAEEKIRAVLTFPGGWLMEEEQGDDTMDTREVGEEDGADDGVKELSAAPDNDPASLLAHSTGSMASVWPWLT